MQVFETVVRDVVAGLRGPQIVHVNVTHAATIDTTSLVQ